VNEEPIKADTILALAVVVDLVVQEFLYFDFDRIGTEDAQQFIFAIQGVRETIRKVIPLIDLAELKRLHEKRIEP
jgi:hypothetical protein